MTTATPPDLLGAGLYSVPDVASLLGLKPARVRRWVSGYGFRDHAQRHQRSQPLFRRDLSVMNGKVALSFLDLVEILFVKAFLKHGVSLHVVRAAAVAGTDMFGTTHPFCVQRFETDGRSIFARLKDDVQEERLLDLVKRQAVFTQVFDPILRQLDYDQVSGDVVRWWPLGKTRPVVVNPRRSFGAPVTADVSVPTRVLYAAHAAGEEPEDIATWYQASLDEVRAAIEFEHARAA
jgi:uncharacterized protein (DUF433 family)